MRRSCYYMGRYYSQRHLNAVNSPLCKGYISPTHFSMTVAGMAAFPLTSIGVISESIVAALASADAAAKAQLESSALHFGISGFGSHVYPVSPIGMPVTLFTLRGLSSRVCCLATWVAMDRAISHIHL